MTPCRLPVMVHRVTATLTAVLGIVVAAAIIGVPSYLLGRLVERNALAESLEAFFDPDSEGRF